MGSNVTGDPTARTLGNPTDLCAFPDPGEPDGHQRTQRLLLEQERLLALIAGGCGCGECLTALTEAVARLHPTTRAAVLMADATGTRMDDVFAADFPIAMGGEVRGLPIDDLLIGTCGAAIRQGRPVSCTDIAGDEQWPKPWRDLCLAHGVRAAHSTPVFGVDRAAVASFFLCFGEAHEPDAWERGIGQFGAHIAAIVLERERTVTTLRAKQAQLDAELAAAQLLQELSAQLVTEDGLEGLYGKLLDGAMALLHADCASMQMLHPERGRAGELRLIGCRGFDSRAARFWEWVTAESRSTCGEALRTGSRVVVTDLDRCERMAGTQDLAMCRQSGIRAVQSTPLIARTGQVLGMLSTHWRRPHRPSEHDLRLLDILARQAADVIESRRVAQALRESEADYRALFASIDEGFCILEVLFDGRGRACDFRFLEANPAHGRHSGLTHVIGRTMRELVPGLNDFWFETFGRIASSGEPARFEHAAEGLHYHRVFDVYAFRIGAPAKRRVAVLFNDVTARRQQQERTGGQKRVLEMIATGESLDAVLDALLRFTEAQEPGVICGLVLTDGAHFRSVHGPGLPSACRQALRGMLRDVPIAPPYPAPCARAAHRNATVPVTDVAQDAHYSPAWRQMLLASGLRAVRSSPVRSIEGQVLGCLALYFREPCVPDPADPGLIDGVTHLAAIAIERDRSAREREQLLAAERGARSEAENANHLKDEFLATLSHELRTPLSNVISWGRVLQNQAGEGNAQLRRGLSVIVDNALIQARMISDLLDMSRIASGKIQLEMRPVDLGPLLRNAVESQRPAANTRNMALSIDAVSEPLIAQADPTRMQQVLWNLLSNAIKFTPEGGRVSVEVRRAGEWAEFSVRDTGVGVSAAFMPYLFDRFRQAEGGSGRRFGGLGLGLALVKQLVELHGGSVHASSAGEGCGATFTVRLPLQDESVRQQPQPQAAHQEGTGRESALLAGLRVLVVEDDAAAREVLERTLGGYGASVVAVASAAAALEALRDTTRFQLLVSDLGLSSMDGFALLHAVRTQYSASTLPAIAVTAFSREEDRVRAMAAGFQAYLTKPYEVSRLIDLTRRLGRRPGSER